jgi:hypothetical protein
MHAITPVQILNRTATQLNIQAVYVRLNTCANVTWQLMDKDGAQVATDVVVIAGSDYAAWGTDDTYILNQVCGQLGVTLVPAA